MDTQSQNGNKGLFYSCWRGGRKEMSVFSHSENLEYSEKNMGL